MHRRRVQGGPHADVQRGRPGPVSAAQRTIRRGVAQEAAWQTQQLLSEGLRGVLGVAQGICTGSRVSLPATPALEPGPRH